LPRRVLITGVNGFTGRHLAATLGRDPGLVVLGTGRRGRPAVPVAGYRPCDLTDRGQVGRLVVWAQPDLVYHLAAAWGDAAAPELEAVNVAGFGLLRDQLRKFAAVRRVRLLVIGSAAELGPVAPEQLPVDEFFTCRPVTPYGVSKHAVVQAALAEPAESGLEIVVARPFNLLGAGLDRRLAPGAFAAAVRAVARGETDTIRTGWLDARRDYLDVADAVAAYRLLADRAAPGTLAHVCSGSSLRLGDILAELMAIAGVNASVHAAPQPRPHDIVDIRGSHARLTALTGWQPRVPLERSLAALAAAAPAADGHLLRAA
jgi:nucleoside-diphosphate-sugar epimerase